MQGQKERADLLERSKAKRQEIEQQIAKEQAEPKPFILPEKSNNTKRITDYLHNVRGISREIIANFITADIIYESAKYGNVVFKGKDKDGNTLFASQRGTIDSSKPFKMDVAGNDKNYGINIVNTESNTLEVFEAGIDMMSYCDLCDDFDGTNKLALGMVADNPLVRFLEEHNHIENIVFCLDADKAGQKSAKELAEKYANLGYYTSILKPVLGKDFNDELKFFNNRFDKNVIDYFSARCVIDEKLDNAFPIESDYCVMVLQNENLFRIFDIKPTFNSNIDLNEMYGYITTLYPTEERFEKAISSNTDPKYQIDKLCNCKWNSSSRTYEDLKEQDIVRLLESRQIVADNICWLKSNSNNVFDWDYNVIDTNTKNIVFSNDNRLLLGSIPKSR